MAAKENKLREYITKEEALDALERIFNYCEEIDLHLPEGDPDRTGYDMTEDVIALRHYILHEDEDGAYYGQHRNKRNSNDADHPHHNL